MKSLWKLRDENVQTHPSGKNNALQSDCGAL